LQCNTRIRNCRCAQHCVSANRPNCDHGRHVTRQNSDSARTTKALSCGDVVVPGWLYGTR